METSNVGAFIIHYLALGSCGLYRMDQELQPFLWARGAGLYVVRVVALHVLCVRTWVGVCLLCMFEFV